MEEQGEPGIRLCPPRGWLGRLRRPDGRLLWDLLEDKHILSLVPRSNGDPNRLAPVLEWFLKTVLREPPRHPYAVEVPLGDTWPRILTVDLADGWRQPDSSGPHRGNDIVITTEGGVGYCDICGRDHPPDDIRWNWWVVQDNGIQVRSRRPECLGTMGRGRGQVAWSKPIPIPIVYRKGLSDWMQAVRKDGIHSVRAQRIPSEDGDPSPPIFEEGADGEQPAPESNKTHSTNWAPKHMSVVPALIRAATPRTEEMQRSAQGSKASGRRGGGAGKSHEPQK
eukprot:gene16844-biopygen10186